MGGALGWAGGAPGWVGGALSQQNTASILCYTHMPNQCLKQIKMLLSRAHLTAWP